MAKQKIKTVQHFLDKNGFVISQEPDLASRGGNSAQHTMIFNITMGILWNQIALHAIDRILYAWGIIRLDGQPKLHWDARYWPGQPGHMSRDNLFCSVLALKLIGASKQLRILMFQITLRLGFMWNTKKIGSDEKNFPDWCGLQMWFIALRFKWSPFNYLFDLYYMISVYIARRKDDSGNHLNLIMLGEVAKQIAPNPLLGWILWEYQDDAIAAVKDYFDNEYSPPLHEPMIVMINKW